MKKCVILFFLISLFIPDEAWPHKVVVFAWVENDRIQVTGSLGSGKKAKNCKITIVDETDHILHQGNTDMQGQFSVEKIAEYTTDITVILEAGPGHKATWILSREELKQANDPMSKKDQQVHIEEGPSLLKILMGVGIIFGLALIIGVTKKYKKDHD